MRKADGAAPMSAGSSEEERAGLMDAALRHSAGRGVISGAGQAGAGGASASGRALGSPSDIVQSARLGD